MEVMWRCFSLFVILDVKLVIMGMPSKPRPHSNFIGYFGLYCVFEAGEWKDVIFLWFLFNEETKSMKKWKQK